jgi:hypothetical protein
MTEAVDISAGANAAAARGAGVAGVLKSDFGIEI